MLCFTILLMLAQEKIGDLIDSGDSEDANTLFGDPYMDNDLL